MKKLLLLTVVLGLLVVGEARADGAWVLWEEIRSPKIVWRIVGAYPSYNSCIQAEEFSCGLIEDGCRICDGGHYTIRSEYDLDSGKTHYKIIYWKCLPETVDPRK